MCFPLSAGEWRGERRMLDITRDKPVKVCVRVVVPVRDHPKVSKKYILYSKKRNLLKYVVCFQYFYCFLFDIFMVIGLDTWSALLN